MENRRNCKKWMNDFPGGVLLISRDEEEKILAVNEEVLRIFECPGEKEFMNLSGSRFRGLMPEEEYHPAPFGREGARLPLWVVEKVLKFDARFAVEGS